jgi:hypothetical protein
MEADMSRKANVEDSIRFQTKSEDGKKYATFLPADRRHGGCDIYLGTVVDESEGIFYNRKYGYFRFTIEGGRSELPAGEAEYFAILAKRSHTTATRQLILDFGDAWFLDYILSSSGLKELFSKILPRDADTLLTLIAFKLLDADANLYAERWADGSYAKYLYPKAHVESQRISEFMIRLGDPETKRRFFDLYILYLKSIPDITDNVLIDSTGLPNDVHFDLAAVNNHNGVISREARLIYVVERNTGLPVYFRCVAGNIVDVSTLRVTINHLKAQGIEIHHGIMDAGYISEKNMDALFENKIPFLIRLSNNATAKDLVVRYGADVYTHQYALKFGERLICMKRIKEMINNHECYVYVGIDIERKNEEQYHYLDKAAQNKKAKAKMTDKAMESMGFFVLVSSEKMETDEVLPLYYMRQTIEQTFDYAKNDVSLMPVRSHNTNTFQGHLMLSFMATVSLIIVKSLLKTRKKLESLSPSMALKAMRYIKCEVYPNVLVSSEGNKYANLITRELGLTVPETVSL